MTDESGPDPGSGENPRRSSAAEALRAIQDQSAAIVGVTSGPGSIAVAPHARGADPCIDVVAEQPVLDLRSEHEVLARTIPQLRLAPIVPWPDAALDTTAPADSTPGGSSVGDRVNGRAWTPPPAITTPAITTPAITTPAVTSTTTDPTPEPAPAVLPRNGSYTDLPKLNGHTPHATPAALDGSPTVLLNGSRASVPAGLPVWPLFPANGSVAGLDLDVSGLWTAPRPAAPTLMQFSNPVAIPIVAVDPLHIGPHAPVAQSVGQSAAQPIAQPTQHRPRHMKPQHTAARSWRRALRPPALSSDTAAPTIRLTYIYVLITVMFAVIAFLAGVLITRTDRPQSPPAISFVQGGGVTSADSTTGK